MKETEEIFIQSGTTEDHAVFWIEEAEKKLLHTYNRFPLVLDRGEGVNLYDVNGKKYLDFTSGIAVFALGYGNEKYNNALKAQIDKLIHTSNFFYNVPTINAAKRLVGLSGMNRVFFTNSGTEAIEGAIKSALKYAYEKKGKGDYEIIAMENSFHGRSLGALSVTGNKKYREPFEPFLGKVSFAKLNDIESLENKLTDKTCAIILETVQGEGGILPCQNEYLQKIRTLCTEKDILLILDEIQCGMGRCGTLFAFEQYDVMPDIFTTAKALGCGVPVGAFLMTEEVAKHSLKPGDHGTTYGGNPLAGAAVNAVLDQFEEKGILKHTKEIGAYLYEKLEELKEKNPHIIAHRGIGLMQGLEFDIPVGNMLQRALESGLILINAGTHVIRFVPPLVIDQKDVDEMIKILSEVLKD